MDLANILELMRENPGSYFVAGLIAGYSVRAYFAGYRIKRPSRYQSIGLKDKERRAPHQGMASNELCFEWADAAVKTLTARRNELSLNQQSKEV